MLKQSLTAVLVLCCVMFGQAQTNLFESHYTQYLQLKQEKNANDSGVQYHLFQAIEAIDSTTTDSLYGEAYYAMAKRLFLRGEHQRSLNYFFSASRQFRSVGDSCKYRRALYNIGTTLSIMGDTYSAIKYYQEYGKINSCNETVDDELLYNYNLATLFHGLEQHQDAKHHFLQVVAKNSGSQRGAYFTNLSKLALSAYDFVAGDTLNAIATHKDILKDTNLSYYASDVFYYGYKELGEYYLSLSEYDSAWHYYALASQISDSLQYPEFQFDDLLNLTDYYYKMQKLDSALTQGYIALHFAQNYLYPDREVEAMARLVNVYVSQSRWDSAFHIKSKISAIKDSILVEKTKFSYLVNEIEQSVSYNVQLDRSYKEAKQKIILRNRALLIVALFISVMVSLLIIVLRQRKKLKLLNNQLTKLNNHKDKIIATLSHDIRTPLAGVESVIELLELGAVNEEEKNMALSKLKDMLGNIRLTVNDLLSWSLSQLKSSTPVKKRCEVASVYEQSLSFIASQGEEKGIRFESEFQPDKLWVYADQNHLQIILRNLLSNAVKFSNPGGKVKVAGRYDDQFTYITVDDSGVGISEENIQRIMNNEAFSQSNPGEGFGLGLRLVKEYTDLNQGTLNLTSEVGKGTCFTLQFPKSER